MVLDYIQHQKMKLPQGWSYSSIDEISLQIDTGFSSGKHNQTKKGIPHLRPMNINSEGMIDLSDVKYIEQPKKYDSLKKGDILFNNTNSAALVGKTTYIEKDTNWAFSNHMTRIRTDVSLFEPKWISHCLHYLFLKGFYKMNRTQYINQASIGKKFLQNNVIIPIPPQNEQYCVVSKIDNLFSLINSNNKLFGIIKNQLKQFRYSLLTHSFEGKMTKSWRTTNKHKIQKEIKQLKNLETKHSKVNGTLHGNNLAKLPEGWIWTKINEITKTGQGGTPRRNKKEFWNGTIPWLRSGEVRNNIIKTSKETISELGLKKSSTTKCPAGTVLIAMTGQGLTRGRTAILEISACANQSVAHMIPNNNLVLSKFLFYYLQSQYWKIRSIEKGSNQPGLNVSIIKQFEIPLPCISEQKEIIKRIESNLINNKKIEKIIDNNFNFLKNLRKSILKWAIAGKLVPQNFNNEPAEIQLEKIRQKKFTRME